MDFGRARCEHDGVLFIGQRYDVAWVLVTERADACGELSRAAACAPGEGGVDAPAGPSRPMDAPPFQALATAGQMAPCRDSGGERVSARCDLTFEDGSRAEGSFSAVRCEVMDERLHGELYDLPRCPQSAAPNPLAVGRQAAQVAVSRCHRWAKSHLRLLRAIKSAGDDR